MQVLSLIQRVWTETHLSIYGVDVIIEDGTNKHYIIDVNYFPGYMDVEVRDLFT